eukprot:scaffold106_cov109-Isochrysis_galbana.AAC.8
MFGVGGVGWGRARGICGRKGGKESRWHHRIKWVGGGGGRPTQGHLLGGMHDSAGHHSVGWASFGGRVFGLSTDPDRTGPPRGPAGETPLPRGSAFRTHQVRFRQSWTRYVQSPAPTHRRQPTSRPHPCLPGGPPRAACRGWLLPPKAHPSVSPTEHQTTLWARDRAAAPPAAFGRRGRAASHQGPPGRPGRTGSGP